MSHIHLTFLATQDPVLVPIAGTLFTKDYSYGSSGTKVTLQNGEEFYVEETLQAIEFALPMIINVKG